MSKAITSVTSGEGSGDDGSNIERHVRMRAVLVLLSANSANASKFVTIDE